MEEKLTTFERRQRILQLVDEKAVVKVVALAAHFDVSEGTIRNDLIALEAEKQLHRVRGGATVAEPSPSLGSVRLARKMVNVDAKKRIAQWAADLIEEGDAIALDASSTVLHMVPCLKQYRRLTVVTNGLETARLVAESTPHTVILPGGILGANANSVTGLLGVEMLEALHVRIAFVSGVGFSYSEGLTERDVAEAQLKKELAANARQVVALVDSTKFGKVGFSPCLSLHALSNVVTDSQAPQEIVQQLRQEALTVTVCGERTVSTYRGNSRQSAYRIGFANLTETGIAFAVDVRRGLERAAEQQQVELVLADNRLSGEQALLVADYLIEKEVDLAIEYQIDASISSLITDKFLRTGIPVIAVDIPMVGATFFGADNYRAGHIAGMELGKWIQQHWQGSYDRLIALEEPRVGELPYARITGQIDGLQEILGSSHPGDTIYLDSGNTSQISEMRVFETLQSLPNCRHIAIVCFNDDAAMGAVRAARSLEREEHVAIIGQGADRFMRHELRKSKSAVIGSTAFMPERYGEKLIELAQRILEGQSVPPAVYMEHVFITAANVDEYYG